MTAISSMAMHWMVEETVSDILRVLKDCRDLQRGRQVHEQAVVNGISSNLYVGNCLISMYGKCGSVSEAQSVFDGLHRRDVVSWTALIQAYAGNGENRLALDLFSRFGKESGCSPSSRTFVAAISACSGLAAAAGSAGGDRWLETGQTIHAGAVQSKCCNMFVQNSLVKMYAQCGSMKLARGVFNSMIRRSRVSWIALLQGYVDNGENELALEAFQVMEFDRCVPDDARIFVIVLKACANLGTKDSSEIGKSLHSRAIKNGCCNIFVENTLIKMYSSCGRTADAREVFEGMKDRDLVSWNSLLHGYVDNGENVSALEIFDRMILSSSCVPNSGTFTAAISACGNSAAQSRRNLTKQQQLWCFEKAKEIHRLAEKSMMLNRDVFVQSALVDMFGKCGRMICAKHFFDCMPYCNSVSCNVLVAGYIGHGEDELGLEILEELTKDSLASPSDSVTYAAGLTACGNLIALAPGKKFHRKILGGGCLDLVLANCLVDFYARCGRMNDGELVFDSIAAKTVVSWTCLMFGYGLQGNTKRVFDVFLSMQEQGTVPNAATFACLLTSCSHAGLTNQGRWFFDAMQSVYGITPTLQHYSCLIDLLGRANHLDEAFHLVRTMPYEADAVAWTTVLGACRKWNDIVLAKIAFEALMKLKGEQGAELASSYELMESIFKVDDDFRSITRWADHRGKIHKILDSYTSTKHLLPSCY